MSKEYILLGFSGYLFQYLFLTDKYFKFQNLDIHPNVYYDLHYFKDNIDNLYDDNMNLLQNVEHYELREFLKINKDLYNDFFIHIKINDILITEFVNCGKYMFGNKIREKFTNDDIKFYKIPIASSFELLKIIEIQLSNTQQQEIKFDKFIYYRYEFDII